MSKETLIAHLTAYSETYLRDSKDYAAQAEERGGSEDLERRAFFALGKSEAFATAASWLKELEG